MLPHGRVGKHLSLSLKNMIIFFFQKECQFRATPLRRAPPLLRAPPLRYGDLPDYQGCSITSEFFFFLTLEQDLIIYLRLREFFAAESWDLPPLTSAALPSCLKISRPLRVK